MERNTQENPHPAISPGCPATGSSGPEHLTEIDPVGPGGSYLQQRWNDLRIGVRLMIGVTIILSLTLIVGLIGWFTLKSQARSQVLANQAIDLVSALRAARQDEKNYMLSGDAKHVGEALESIGRIKKNSEKIRSFLPRDRREEVTRVQAEGDIYQNEFENFVALNRKKELSLKEMVTQGRKLENTAVLLREDQKRELQRLEKLAITLSDERQEKSEKADDANRMIKLMGQARQQEKNFLLRIDPRYADETIKLVNRLITQAKYTKSRFADKENKALAQQIILAAGQYILELNKVVLVKQQQNSTTLETMIQLGRSVEKYAVKLRADQKQELLKLEQQARQASAQRLDKREKVDFTNRIIQLMAEARQQEKNFLLRRKQSYVELTRKLVNQSVYQAQLLRERFQDTQNRMLADKIISAAKMYLDEFEDVVIAQTEQEQQMQSMVKAARKIEALAGSMRQQTQMQADRSRKTAALIILVTLSMALILGIAAAIILTNSISRPIKQLVDVINKLAQEDNVDVPLVANQDEIGQIARAISNFKEVILQRKEKTEAQLLQAEKMAALGDLVAGVAHEINTPIGIAVTGSSHLQDQINILEKNFSRGTLKKSEFKKIIDNAIPIAITIQSNLERASALIKSFKQVAVDQSSQEMRRFKLIEYIDNVLLSLQPKVGKTPHEITLEGDEQLTIEAVPGAISQVITNLILNTLDHAYEPDSPPGEIKILIETTGHTVIVHYSDNGKGMDEEVAKRMYEPFFTTRRSVGGSGLGLSIIFNLVTQTLGGSIQCRTARGKGARFTIRFPLKPQLQNGMTNHE